MKYITLWLLKRLLRAEQNPVRKIHKEIINILLEDLEDRFVEDTLPTHPYYMTHFLCRVIANRYKWNKNMLAMIKRGMFNEIDKTFDKPGYNFIN